MFLNTILKIVKNIALQGGIWVETQHPTSRKPFRATYV